MESGVFMVGGPASAFLVVLMGVWTLLGMLPSVADLAGDVAVGEASPAVAGVASLAVAGVAPLADLAGGVIEGVASLADAGVVSLADAGVASLADAGVASLADLTGSVAGKVTDLAVLVRVETDGVTLLRECVVRHCSVFGDSVCRDIEVDCCGCVSPNASVCVYVNYVGHRRVVTIIRSGRYPLNRCA